MTKQLSQKEHIVALYKAAQACGMDPNKLTGENPFSKSGATAEMLQVALQAESPVIAAELRQAAGIMPNLAALYAMESGEQLSSDAKQNLAETSPEFAQRLIDDQEKYDQKVMAEMAKAADEMRWQAALRDAGGDERRAKERIALEDKNAAQSQQYRQQRGLN